MQSDFDSDLTGRIRLSSDCTAKMKGLFQRKRQVAGNIAGRLPAGKGTVLRLPFYGVQICKIMIYRKLLSLCFVPIGRFRSFGLTQKNQKVKAAPAGLLRFAAGGKWMKLASLKQHPFLVRPPRRSASRPSSEAGPFLPTTACFCSEAGPFLLTTDSSALRTVLSCSTKIVQRKIAILGCFI